jgi:hypothetical protein
MALIFKDWLDSDEGRVSVAALAVSWFLRLPSHTCLQIRTIIVDEDWEGATPTNDRLQATIRLCLENEKTLC